jgi:hypothetical protein
MPETETKELIIQAARELQIENSTVTASPDRVGFYAVEWVVKRSMETFSLNNASTPASSREMTVVAKSYIPMDADFKSIIAMLKTGQTE